MLFSIILTLILATLIFHIAFKHIINRLIRQIVTSAKDIEVLSLIFTEI